MYSCLYAAHQRNRAVLLLVVEEERTVRKPADKVKAPVLLDNPVLSHADIIPKTRLLYQFYCINKLRPFILLALRDFPKEVEHLAPPFVRGAPRRCTSLGVEEERTVHKPVNKVIAPVLLYSPVLSYKDVQMICGNVTVTVAPIPGAELSETFPP